MKILVLLMTFLISSAALAFDAGKHFKKVCAVCHTIGNGDKTGPDLAGLSKRRKVEWIHKFINYPSGMKEGDDEEVGYEKADALAIAIDKAYPKTNMADQELSMDQVKAMLKYIDGLKKTPKGKIVEFEKNRKK